MIWTPFGRTGTPRWLLAASLMAVLACFLMSTVATGNVPPQTKTAHLSALSDRPIAAVTLTGKCQQEWQQAPSVNVPGATRNHLFAIEAVSSSDVWAVGYYPDAQQVSHTLIEHWDGSEWQIVPSPSPGNDSNLLSGISAVSANDVWAVGHYDSGTPPRTLTLHWDGIEWGVVPSPNVGTQSILRGVHARAPDDVWAVGIYLQSGFAYTLTMHWDGKQWTIHPSPNLGRGNTELWDVHVLAADYAWAVGHYLPTDGGSEDTLIMRWDGVSWSVVPSPNPPEEAQNLLYGISATSANDAWAVGSTQPGTLILHWDGSTWSIVPSPSPGTNFHVLYSVSAVTLDNAWAVGNYGAGGNRTMVLRWDGLEWTQEPSPNPGTIQNILYDVSAVSQNDVWAGGYIWSGLNRPFLTLIIRRVQVCTTRTPTPSPTPSISPTATTTATPCPMSFSDVQTSDYFYEAVRYLYCMGAISGYADNTFRPYNNNTRGQLTKIVVLAEGWKLYLPPAPTFSDVPQEDPFFTYVETAFQQDIISGYSDGTFRPYSPVTRGQLCKIVVLAEGWSLVDPSDPTFTDVPHEHPFFRYIETAYLRKIISGYSDGTFRPGAEATRGQIAKIVYNAVITP